MSQDWIEVSEKTLDDAITVACQKLSVTSEKLEYEVLDQGSTGFLGFNSRNAVIKARVKADANGAQISGDVLENAHEVIAADAVIPETEPVKATSEDRAPKKPAKSGKRFDRDSLPKKAADANHKYAHTQAYSASDDDFLKTSSDYEPEHIPEHKERKPEPHIDYTQEQIAEIKNRAHVFLVDVFKAMNMEVTVTEQFDTTENILTVDFEGDDMGLLIGKRGQTLDSIQYLVSLIVNKGMEGYVHVKADTENYRERRKKTLENLAKNIAYKVKRSRKSVALEPMNPYERRIIHSALQNDRYVTTYSEGEDPYRKVVVTLKK